MNLDVFAKPGPAVDEPAGRSFALPSRYIRFASFQIDLHRQELSKDGARVHLQGKAFHVLLALLEKPREIVTREELRGRLWPADTHVNYDANVNTTVNKLRQALGDSSDRPLYIETIPRRGYCILAQPEFSDQPFPVASPAVPAVSVAAATTLQGGSGSRRPAYGAHSSVWITLGVIGLILAGMLLGAGIATLWISHFAPRTSFL